MDVNRVAEVSSDHCGAFNVPARSSSDPKGYPSLVNSRRMVSRELSLSHLSYKVRLPREAPSIISASVLLDKFPYR